MFFSPTTPPKFLKSPYNLRGLKVLVMEDFPYMADLMVSMLMEFSVGKVFTACNLEECQALLDCYNISTTQNTHIDIIITDLLPPQKTGFELIRWVRTHQEESIRYLPILFCSAHTRLNIVEEGRDFGANEILVKPLTAEKLAHRLLHIIDYPRSYVKAPQFFGPDRRRKEKPFTGQDRRTLSEQDMRVSYETA